MADPRQALDALLAASGKLSLLDRMTAALLKRGHRLLIYSQVHVMGGTLLYRLHAHVYCLCVLHVPPVPHVVPPPAHRPWAPHTCMFQFARLLLPHVYCLPVLPNPTYCYRTVVILPPYRTVHARAGHSRGLAGCARVGGAAHRRHHPRCGAPAPHRHVQFQGVTRGVCVTAQIEMCIP